MRKKINVSILEIREEGLYLAGNIPNFSRKTESFFIQNEKKERIVLHPVRAKAMDGAATASKSASKGFFYDALLPVYPGARYRFFYKKGKERIKLIPSFGKYSRLSNLPHSFFCHDDLLLKAVNNGICIYVNQLRTRLASSWRFRKTLRVEGASKALEIRSRARKEKKRHRPIWLITDRTDAAGDNGEALFRYLMNSKAASERDIFFVIGEDSEDYQKMKEVGPVLAAGTEEHLVMQLAASMVISSAGDDWIINPFGKDRKYYQDMIEYPFVFLQHGVIKDDLSKWLYVLKKNLRIFICSTRPEWESICHGDYGYDERVVKLTGLARYDRLENHPRKTIAILPTWRKSAAPKLIPGTSERPYSETFRESEYYKFYDSLINDQRLLQALRKCGYKGIFYIHPNHRKQCSDFHGNEVISVWEGLIPFSEVFSNSALMVTDYSSVAIDFAYLQKPVIYAQFDKEMFFATHSYTQGYYDYERDGFGPVCPDLDGTVDAIIGALERDCQQEEVYRKRVEAFFAFNDRGNCERIYQELQKL